MVHTDNSFKFMLLRVFELAFNVVTCRTLTFFKDASKNTVTFGSDVDDEDMVIGCMCMCDADTKMSCADYFRFKIVFAK
jgi:hypothetical protein